MAKKINLGTLARDVVLEEHGKIEVPIGQVKEILRVTFNLLAMEKPSDVLALLERVTVGQ